MADVYRRRLRSVVNAFGTLYDVSEVVVSVGFGLVISLLFSLLVVGRLSLRVEDGTRALLGADTGAVQLGVIGDEAGGGERECVTLEEVRVVSEQTAWDTMEDAQVLTQWRALTRCEFWLLIAVLLTMIRIEHSFLILMRSSAYDGLQEGLPVSKRFFVRFMQLIGQAGVLFFGVRFVAAWDGNQFVPLLLGLAFTGVLLVWDGPVFWIMKGASDCPEGKILESVFRWWWRFDIVVVFALLCCTAYFYVTEVAGSPLGVSQKKDFIELALAVLLCGIFILDYCLNGRFYFPPRRSVDGNVRSQG